MTATITTFPIIYGRNENIVRTNSATIIIPPAFVPKPKSAATMKLRARRHAERMDRCLAESLARGCTHDDALAYANAVLAKRLGDA